MTIPNIIHFIFGLKPDFGGKPFSYVHYLAVASAAAVNRPDDIVLHYAHEPSGPWWDAARPLLTLNQTAAPEDISGRPLKHFAHKADVMRLQILARDGGAYLDLDTFCVQPFQPLRIHQTVLAREPGAGLCNAVILSRPNAPFIDNWLDQYRHFDDAVWNGHSVWLPFKLAQEEKAPLHIVDEFGFFFPHFSDPKHAWLWSHTIPWTKQVRSAARGMRHGARALRGDKTYNAGAALRCGFADQHWYFQRMQDAYCLHLWESLWWEPYLSTLSPETIRNGAGAYARLVRQVLPDAYAP